MKAFARRLCYWLPPLAWAAGIFVMSSLPALPRPPAYPHEDKVLHALFFGVLGLLVLRALLGERKWRPGRAALAAVAAASLYGALDEAHQRFTPGRSVEWGDWIADTAGAALLVLAASCLVRRERMS